MILFIAAVFGVAVEIFYFAAIKKPQFKPQETVMAQDVSAPVLKQTAAASPVPSLVPTTVPTSKPINLRETYTNDEYSFTFSYPKTLSVQPDSEEDFAKRFGGDNKANFTSYVGYAPGKLLSAVAVLDKDSSFDNSPLTIWIFDNPNQLTVDQWFDKYWYYPFLWGVFDKTSKGHVILDQEATISSQTAKYKIVSYQPGAPKYLYLEHGGKMFLIRVLTASDQTGENILQSFKFTN